MRLLLAIALAAQAPSPSGVVEEVVAVVRDRATSSARVVTLTKLVEEARIALVSRGATEAATGPLDAEALGAALDWLLGQILLADDAARLGVAEVPREDALAELRRFRARFDSPEDYARFLRASDLPEEELVVTLARMLRVERYVASRVGRSPRVADADLDAWLRARGTSAAPGPAREAARAQIAEERTRAEVRDLVGELRARAEVRIVSPPRGVGGEGEIR